MDRIIAFRAKLNTDFIIAKRGTWYYGLDYGFGTPIELVNNITTRGCGNERVVQISSFWEHKLDGYFDNDTIGQYVQWGDLENQWGFEGDIISKGGANHNSVIVFNNEKSMFMCKESYKGYGNEIYNDFHTLYGNNPIIGNIWDNKKLRSRWGRS